MFFRYTCDTLSRFFNKMDIRVMNSERINEDVFKMNLNQIFFINIKMIFFLRHSYMFGLDEQYLCQLLLIDNLYN